LRDEYDKLDNLIGLKKLKEDDGNNYIRLLDSRDQWGNTALMNACWKGHHFVAEFLIKSGASINLQVCLRFRDMSYREAIYSRLVVSSLRQSGALDISVVLLSYHIISLA